MAALSEVANKFEDIRVVSQDVQFLHLFEFGRMDTAEDRLRCRVVYYSAS